MVRAYGFSHTGKKMSSTLGPESYCPSGVCVCALVCLCVCVCVSVYVCRMEVWKSVLPESLSAIFLVVSLFVSFFLPFKEIIPWGFPGGAVVENLPANARDTDSSPGLGRSHMPRSN